MGQRILQNPAKKTAWKSALRKQRRSQQSQFELNYLKFHYFWIQASFLLAHSFVAFRDIDIDLLIQLILSQHSGKR